MTELLSYRLERISEQSINVDLSLTDQIHYTDLKPVFKYSQCHMLASLGFFGCRIMSQKKKQNIAYASLGPYNRLDPTPTFINLKRGSLHSGPQ